MTPHDKLADLAAASSAATAGFTWVAQLNEILQLGATAVAIVAGIYAIKWHRARIAELRRTSEQSNRDRAGETPRDDS